MPSKAIQAWIPSERIAELVQLEPALVIIGLCAGAWLIYRILLRKTLFNERQRNLRGHFNNLWIHTLGTLSSLLTYFALTHLSELSPPIARIQAYIGLIALIWGAVTFVKVCRILVLEYLYFSHMRVAFPLLVINIFTLILSAVIGGWLATEIFNIRLAPLLATSAIFSIVLGLALQETLGNLFAGISMQFDKSYEIGDWLEIYNGSQKWVGQVEEITWRATLLIGMADELITVSNRNMAQAQISNFSNRGKPFVRSQIFRIPFGHAPEKVCKILEEAANECKKIRKDAPAFSIVFETTEHWVTYKLIYFIDNYGTQYLVANEVLTKVFKCLEEAGIELAGPRLQLQGTHEAVHPAIS